MRGLAVHSKGKPRAQVHAPKGGGGEIAVYLQQSTPVKQPVLVIFVAVIFCVLVSKSLPRSVPKGVVLITCATDVLHWMPRVLLTVGST